MNSKRLLLTALLLLAVIQCVWSGALVGADRNVDFRNHGSLAVEPRPVSGKVITSEAGESLPGVNIIIKGTTIGTVTDVNGDYQIEVDGDDVILVFSFVGYLNQEVAIGNRSVANVTLSPDIQALDEIVVVGYGTQKMENLTGSVSVVDQEVFQDRPVQNPLQAMQGQVPGVQIVQSSGSPGNENMAINIRGFNSFGSSNNPLILVDGVEGNINDLAPDMIESISILKDASSAAIYGSRASNGVILVTTKRGKNKSLAITYSGQFSSSNPAVVPDMITDSATFMELLNEAVQNSPGASANPYPADLISAYRSSNGDPALPSTNWDDVVLNDNVLTHNHSINVTGSTDKTNFNVSLGVWDQEGLQKYTDYQKYNILLGLDSKVTERITIGATLFGLHSDRTGATGNSSALQLGWKARPTWGPYTLDGTGHYAAKAFSGTDPQFPGFDEGFTRENPLGLIEADDGYSEQRNNFNGNVYIDVEILDGLVWSTKGAYKFDYRFGRSQTMLVEEYNYRTGEFLRNAAATTNPNIQITDIWTSQSTLYSTLTYNKDFGSHHLQGLVGYSQENWNTSRSTSTRNGVSSRAIKDLNGAGQEGQTTTGSSGSWATRGWFGRLNYDFKSKYFVEANVRADESSRFSEGNRLGVFPSFSAGWRLSEESFFNPNFVDELKIRGSWGQLGNQNIGLYPYQSTMDFDLMAYPFSTGIASGVGVTRLVDTNITWETTTISDVGMDVSLWNGLISGSVDYYNKVTSDILRGSQVNESTGLSAPTVNSGEMTNKGWDILLGHENTVFNDVRYSINANISWYKNELTNFGELEVGSETANEEGFPWNDWYLWESDGLYRTQGDLDNAPEQPIPNPSLGDISLKDQNGDGIVDGNDRVHLGGRYPDFTYGFNLSVNWKGFDFYLFFQGVEGINRYVDSHGVDPFRQDGNTNVVWLDHAWSAQNPDGILPEIYYETSDERRAINYKNSFWLRDYSYMRLKNLTLGYTLPSDLTERISLDRVRFYVAGNNLATFNNDLFGFEPERTPGGNQWDYPQLKSLTMGLNVTF